MSDAELGLSRDGWRQVQQKLKDLGFYFGKVDGLRGPLTDDAIRAFKRSIGYANRPFYGELTHAALFRVPPVKEESGKPELPWIANARKLYGLHESRDKSKLLEAFKGIVASWVDPREVAWCGAFVAVCLKQWKTDVEVPGNILGARQWGNFGTACKPQRGAVLTFWRGSKSGWQGHVGFMVGQDSTTFHVLGGNQSDAVTIARLSKDRLLQARWPVGHPESQDPAYGTLAGSISTNEA